MDSIRTVASREIYRNSWFSLREDDIRRPDGSNGVYTVVDKPTYALVIARTAIGSTWSSSSATRLGCADGSFPRAQARI